MSDPANIDGADATSSAGHCPSLPMVKELRPAPQAQHVFRRLAGRRHCIFLDSVMRHATLGRYSFVAADPFQYLQSDITSRDSLQQLATQLQAFHAESITGLPPFQGGAAGVLSYDLNRQLERIPSPRYDEFQFPALAMGLYDTVIAWDHQTDRAWIISQGFPEIDIDARIRRARERIAQFEAWILNDSPPAITPAWGRSPLPREAFHGVYPTDRVSGVLSNFDEARYHAAIAQAIERIRDGDIFQVNLAQRLLTPAIDDSVALYLRVRERNAATFAGYFDLGDRQIISASPERFLRVSGREVEARPIKGTRRRTRRAEADLYAGDDLRASEKDRAENVMIVDLMRNDLSKVCEVSSIRVPELCRLERYEYVQHLVSCVCGQLRADLGLIDLLRATFPGGSITGAPKIRAMEIIAELEPCARGAYCGSLGYLGFDGQMDLSILIRTITADRGWWQFPVGGGIVVQSSPQLEYEETWHKAEGLLRSLQPH